MNTINHQKHTCKFIEDFFRIKGNKKSTYHNASTGSLEIGLIDCTTRAELTDSKISFARHYLDEFISDKRESADRIRRWNAMCFELGGIMNDVVVFEMLHYACVYFDWVRDPDKIEDLQHPGPGIKKKMLQRIKNSDKGLHSLYSDLWDKTEEFRYMRNFLAHTGALFLFMRVGDPNNTGVIGYSGSDVIGIELLKKAGFHLNHHAEHKYMISKAVEWYNLIVDCVDQIRDYAIQNSPLFAPTVVKHTSELSVVFARVRRDHD